jgi:hypothetical protein
MDISLKEIRSQGARDTFFDVASIIAVVLIGLVLLVLANPRFGRDLGTVWLHQGTQSNHVTQGTLAP